MVDKLLIHALLTVIELTQTLHRCMDSTNCHRIDINPTLLQGVAKEG